MADSNITKNALAAALKQLMEHTSLQKITVAQICDKCGMNRKSFYYHFKDKFDLVNWIFDTDFIALSLTTSADRWEFMEHLCQYFYQNKVFYQRALQVKGQNSFSDHLREFLCPLLQARVERILGLKDIPKICVDFFADGIVCAIERWLLDKNAMPPEHFVATIKQIVQGAAYTICQETQQNK